MTLEVLQKEMISAMKNKNKLRKDTISSLIGAVKKIAIDNMCKDNIPESLVDSVLLKEKKSMQEMIDTCPKDRVATLNEYNQKMQIIKEFAPEIISDEEQIKNIIINISNENNIEMSKKNKSNVMKVVMPALKNKVDMKVANKIINALLV